MPLSVMQLSNYQTTEAEEFPVILVKVAGANRAAAEDCIDAYGDLIWTLAKRYTDSNEEAEKATEEIFLDIWQYAERFEMSGLDEVTFIFFIARWRLIKRLA